MKKTLNLILLLTMCGLYAQQEASFTQYSISPSMVNPAYATSEFITTYGVVGRQQWQNTFQQKSISAFGQIPINDNIETSFNITSDDLANGLLKQNFVGLNFAYILQLNEKSRLSLGLRGGLNSLTKNFDNITLEQGTVFTDQAFDVPNNSFVPIVGVGAFYYRKNYYVGLSIPTLFKNEALYTSGNKLTILSKSEKFLTAGYVFDYNDNIKIKPNLLLKYNEGLFYPNALLNVLFYERFEVGYMNKFDISNNFMIGFTISENFVFNYTYEMFNKNLGSITSNANEFSIRYRFSKNSHNAISPRFY